MNPHRTFVSPILCLVLLALLFPGRARPAEVFINLADVNPAPPRISVSTGLLQVTITSVLPTKKKEYTVTCQYVPASLQSPLEPALTAAAQAADAEAADPCPELRKAVKGLTEATAESEVPGYVSQIQASAPQCTDDALKIQALALLAETRLEKACSQEIGTGDALIVTITRGQTKWEYTFEEPSPGVWFPTYGFTFLPNEDERYFTRAVEGEEGRFEIVEKGDNQELDFVPTVLFNYLPKKWRNRPVSYSVIGGLGADFDADLTVVFGGSILFNHNLSLVGGIALHQQDRLNGRFDLDDPFVGEDLTEDQLVEQTFDTNWFVGVAFRFGTKPKTHEPRKPKEGGGSGQAENRGTKTEPPAEEEQTRGDGAVEDIIGTTSHSDVQPRTPPSRTEKSPDGARNVATPLRPW